MDRYINEMDTKEFHFGMYFVTLTKYYIYFIKEEFYKAADTLLSKYDFAVY